MKNILQNEKRKRGQTGRDVRLNTETLKEDKLTDEDMQWNDNRSGRTTETPLALKLHRREKERDRRW